MKKISLFFFLSFVIMQLPAQFNGTLHYESDYKDAWFASEGKVLTTISESGSMIRIDALDTNFSKKHVTFQNTILIDLTKGTETHLVQSNSTAVIYSISNKEKMIQAADDKAHTVYQVENLGAEKIGNYNCTHYLITKSYAKLKTMKPALFDIWITKDLGSSNVWYVGKYLYYFTPMELFKKLAAIGADGIMVKWQETANSKTTCILSGYEIINLRSSIFAVPSNYIMNDISNFQLNN